MGAEGECNLVSLTSDMAKTLEFLHDVQRRVGGDNHRLGSER